ncbi:hypothetical protein MAQ58_18825 [Enterobacter sp. DRP3]|nr:hypothetical protein [Enterobacter sp. DRP3]
MLDTNIISDFHEARCLHLLWQLYPGGVWIDPHVSEELRRKFGLDVHQTLAELQLDYNFTNDYAPELLAEMLEIKQRRRALKFADISCIINARLNDAVCLSADNAVYKLCQERNVLVARHGGLLAECVRRELITKAEALEHLTTFLNAGLTMPDEVRDNFFMQFS